MEGTYYYIIVHVLLHSLIYVRLHSSSEAVQGLSGDAIGAGVRTATCGLCGYWHLYQVVGTVLTPDRSPTSSIWVLRFIRHSPPPPVAILPFNSKLNPSHGASPSPTYFGR